MPTTALTTLHLENFTAFAELDLAFSPGMNVFVGANSTGKTHLLKLLYAVSDITVSHVPLGEKLLRVFLPSAGQSSMVHKGHSVARIRVGRDSQIVEFELRRDMLPDSLVVTGFGEDQWASRPMECVFIPPKEMLANAPGFLSSWERRELNFEEVYPDLLRRAYLGQLRKGQLNEELKRLSEKLQDLLDGEVVVKGQEFFRRQGRWDLEFSLLAEGYRKLGLLWLLIRNGTIAADSILFWDEPESNLNPKMMGHLVELLLDLQRIGVQIFLATHSYVVVKELDLRMKSTDRVRFFSLYREEQNGEIVARAADEFASIDPNLIVDTLVDLYDRDVERVVNIGGSK